MVSLEWAPDSRVMRARRARMLRDFAGGLLFGVLLVAALLMCAHMGAAYVG